MVGSIRTTDLLHRQTNKGGWKYLGTRLILNYLKKMYIDKTLK